MVRGLQAEWERESRARLAVAEEEAELSKAQDERDFLQRELSRLENENQQLLSSLKAAQKVLAGVRDSRGFQLFRLVGCWDGLEQGINARLAAAEEQREVAQIRAEAARLQNENQHLQNENQHLQNENQHLQNENQQLLTLLKTAKQVLVGLRASRGYRLFRLMGRWASLERGIDQLAKPWSLPQDRTSYYPRVQASARTRR
ncbi:MAG: hypothetical protein IT306_12940 [Chloroflexi bacterium]|nr:hypothetical protein [Chloroflexota bacterium]